MIKQKLCIIKHTVVLSQLKLKWIQDEKKNTIGLKLMTGKGNKFYKVHQQGDKFYILRFKFKILSHN